MGRHHLVARLLAGIATIAPTAAWAQSADSVQKQATSPPGPTNSTDAPGQNGIEEIVVTARRAEESQQSVPVAITTVTGERLRTAVVSSTDDIQRLVPSLQVNQTTTGQLDFIIRGSFAGFGVDPSVISYIDDVPQDPRAIVYGLFDLGSVQQLKGPQGTLFGRNSTGGAVLFTSKRPDLNGPGGFANIRVGNLDERRIEAAVNLPLGPTLAVRLAGQVERRDGTFRSVTRPGFDYDNRDNAAIRGSVLWQPSDRIENYTQATHYRVDERRSPFIAVSLAGPCTSPVTPALACLYQAPFNSLVGTDNLRAFADQQFTLPFGQTVNNDPIADNQERDSVTNTLTIDLGSLSLRNTSYFGDVSLYISRDYDGTPARVVDANQRDRIKSFYTETQAFGTLFGDRLDWRLGVVYNNDRGHSVGYQNVFPFPVSLVTPRTTDSRTTFLSTAVFGQATLGLDDLLDSLSVTAGYRYTWDRRRIATTAFSGTPNQVCALQVLPVPATGPVAFPGTTLADCTRNLRANNSNDNYNLSVQWQPTDDLLLYAATRKGYKTGSFNVLAVDPALAQYEPEVVKDIEIGLKADWRLGSIPIRTNVAAFRAKYNNVQTSLTLVDPMSGSVTAVTINQDRVTGLANKATVQGFEIETTVIPVSWLQLSAFYSYVDAKYDRFFTIAPRLDLSGAKVGGTTPQTFGASGQLRVPVTGPFDALTATATYYWRAAPNTNAASSLTAFPGRAYEQIDARLGVTNLFDKGIELAAFVKNLTNNRDVLSNNIVSGEVTNRYTEPRTYGLDLTVRFGTER